MVIQNLFKIFMVPYGRFLYYDWCYAKIVVYYFLNNLTLPPPNNLEFSRIHLTTN